MTGLVIVKHMATRGGHKNIASPYFKTTKTNNMSNEIVKLSGNEIMSMGKAFHESGMFPDIKTAAQAVVKIQAGAEIGIPPFAAMSGIHIIQGKPTIGAGLIASAVKGSGKYDYRVTQQDEKCCSIDFYQGKDKLGNSTFTIEDAKKAQTKNLDKFPKNMLFARAISNGVKWFCPDVFSRPVYVPEEMEQVTEDVKHEEVKPEPPVGKPLKPLTSKAFGEAMGRIQAGELDLIDKVTTTYQLTDEQTTEINKYRQPV